MREDTQELAEGGPARPAPPGRDLDLHSGIPLLDLQHGARVELFRRLRARVRPGPPGPDPGEVLRELRDTALAHFAAEEALMARCAYLLRREHQAGHADFILMVLRLSTPPGGSVPAPAPGWLAPGGLEALEAWLADHRQADLRLARFLGGPGH